MSGRRCYTSAKRNAILLLRKDADPLERGGEILKLLCDVVNFGNDDPEVGMETLHFLMLAPGTDPVFTAELDKQ